MKTTSGMPATLRGIVARHGYDPCRLVAILQDIQKEYSYLPPEMLKQTAALLGVPVARVYSVATFYRAFSLKPRGKHIVTVCLGTACHVRKGGRLLDTLNSLLGVSAGETTADGLFTVETVNCLGACAVGPVVVVDGMFHGNMTPVKLSSLIRQLSSGTRLR